MAIIVFHRHLPLLYQLSCNLNFTKLYLEFMYKLLSAILLLTTTSTDASGQIAMFLDILSLISFNLLKSFEHYLAICRLLFEWKHSGRLTETLLSSFSTKRLATAWQSWRSENSTCSSASKTTLDSTRFMCLYCWISESCYNKIILSPLSPILQFLYYFPFMQW